MYKDKVSVLFARYAVPQLVGLLFNSVYVIVDGVFIGNRLGRDAMAAAAVSVPLVELLIAVSTAIASGSGVMISGLLGRGEKERARRIFMTAIKLALAMSLLFAVFGNIFIHPLAQALGSTTQIHAEAVQYLWFIVTFSPFQVMSFLLGGLARNDGCPRQAMIALMAGSLSNVFLDWLFMYPMNMGISGAALATAIGPIFSVMILLPHFLLKKGDLYFIHAALRISDIRHILTMGFPSFIMEFTIGIITFVYNTAIGVYGFGEIGLAAYLVIGYLMLIILTLFLGMAEGLQPVFSFLSGTGRQEKCDELRRFSTAVFLLVGIAGYALIVFFSRQFYTLFSPEDSELVSFAAARSRVYFCGFFLAGFNILMISCWQSTGNVRKAIFISLSRSIIWPPALILMLPHIFGDDAVWICHSASECLTAVAAFGLLLYENNRERTRAVKHRSSTESDDITGGCERRASLQHRHMGC